MTIRSRDYFFAYYLDTRFPAQIQPITNRIDNLLDVENFKIYIDSIQKNIKSASSLPLSDASAADRVATATISTMCLSFMRTALNSL